MGFRVLGSEFRVSGSGFRVLGSGFQVSDFGFRVCDLGLLVFGLWFRGLVPDFGFWVLGSGFQVSGFGLCASVFELRASGFGIRVLDLEHVRGGCPPEALGKPPQERCFRHPRDFVVPARMKMCNRLFLEP